MLPPDFLALVLTGTYSLPSRYWLSDNEITGGLYRVNMYASTWICSKALPVPDDTIAGARTLDNPEELNL